MRIKRFTSTAIGVPTRARVRKNLAVEQALFGPALLVSLSLEDQHFVGRRFKQPVLGCLNGVGVSDLAHSLDAMPSQRGENCSQRHPS
jgi:hypothetical protein